MEVHGSGEPVLLIAGHGGLASFWEDQRALLETRHQVITFDHRGRGRSDRPRTGHSIPRLASDATAIIDHLDIGTVSVVGHSTGGMVAQALALDVPAKAGLSSCARLSYLLGYTPEWIDAHEDEISIAVASSATLSEADPAIDTAQLQMLLDYDCAVEIQFIKSPTLIVAAVDDGIIPIRHGYGLAAMTGARLVVTQGGHF